MFDWIKSQLNGWMQPLQMKLAPHWQQLQPREQLAVKVLAGVLLFALLYFGVVQPIVKQHQQAKTQLQHSQQQWAWMVKQAEQVQQLRIHSKRTSSLRFHNASEQLAKLQQLLRQYGLNAALDKLVPVSTSQGQALRLQFKQAPADRLFQWLDVLEQLGWVAEKIQLSPVKQGGKRLSNLVTGTVILPSLVEGQR